MPFPLIPIAIGGAALAGGALLLRAKRETDKAGVLSECNEIRRRLEQAALAGQPPNVLASLRIDLQDCARRAGSVGAKIDIATINLLPCISQRDYLSRVFRDYTATSYLDTVARDGKRGALLAAGREVVMCLRDALNAAATDSDIRAVMREIAITAAESRARAGCFFDGGYGCGRFAVNEIEGKDRGWAEIEAIGIPLGVGYEPGFGYYGWDAAFASAAGIPPTTEPGAYGGLRLIGERKLAAIAATRTMVSGDLASATGLNIGRFTRSV